MQTPSSNISLKEVDEAYELGRASYVTGAKCPYIDHSAPYTDIILAGAWKEGLRWEEFRYKVCGD